MDHFTARQYIGHNQHGKPMRHTFVSRRLGALMQKKKDQWLHRMFDLKPFTVFDQEYLAILVNTDGLIIFIKYEDVDRYLERNMCSELMALFVKKNVNLSFVDLMKFSEKHGLNLDVNFK